MDGNINDLVDKILEFLMNIGEPLATKGFELATKRIYFFGVRNIVVTLIFFIAMIWFIKTCKTYAKYYGQWKSYTFKDDIKPPHDDDTCELISMATFVFSILSLWIWGVNLIYALDYFINPEWNAVKLIIKLVN